MKTRLKALLLKCQPLIAQVQTQALTKLNARWQVLAPREQNIVLAGSVVTGLLLIYALLWSPLNEHLDHLRDLIQKEKKTAVWMEAANQQIQFLSNQAAPLSDKMLSRRLNTVQEALSQASVHQYLSQLSQNGPGEIRCVFNQINFDVLIAWLLDFTQEQNVIIKQAAIQKLNNVGLVKAEWVFALA